MKRATKESGPDVDAVVFEAPRSRRGCGWLLLVVVFLQPLDSLTSWLFSLLLAGEGEMRRASSGAPLSWWPLVGLGLYLSLHQLSIRVGRRRVTIRRTLSKSVLSLRKMSGLFFYPDDKKPDILGTYYLETLDGEDAVFKLAPSSCRTEEVTGRARAAVAAIADRAGLEWKNMSPDSPRHLRELWLLADLRRITGLGRVAFFRWLLEHSLAPRLEVMGSRASRTVGPLLGLLLASFFLAGLAGAVSEESQWPIYLAIGGYMLLCLTVNVLALVVRHQRRDREAVQREIEAAETVQRGLVPAAMPNVPGFDIAAHYAPARNVAGDYVDLIEIDDMRAVAVIADVSDKGLAAGLLMTMAKGHLTARLKGGDELVPALTLLDREVRVSARGRGRMFITMCLVELRPHASRILVARAGHEPPIQVAADGSLREILPSGVALGIDPSGRFAERCATEPICLQPGEALVLFTDGVTEARDVRSEPYGEERLRLLLTSTCGQPARRVVDALVADVERFRSGAVPSDDLTVLVIRRTSDP